MAGRCRRAKLALGAWLGTSIVLAQHRSVWVAAAVAGVLVLGAFVRGSRQRLVAGTLAVIVGLAVVLGVGAVVRSQTDLAASASSTGTFDWRIENWTEKLTTPRSDLEWLVGSAAGPTPLSDPESNVVFKVSSHSMYVETIATLGVLGLGLLLARHRRRRSGVRAQAGLLASSLFALWLSARSTSGRGSSGS